MSREGLPLNTKPSDATLEDYNSHTIKQYGTITMPCNYHHKHDETFYIVNVHGPVIFALSTCTKLGLVKMQCEVTTTAKATQNIKDLDGLIKQYPNNFKGIGNFCKAYHLMLEDNVTPVKHLPRKAPILLQEKIQAELKRMVELNVIRAVEEPTDWVSSITYVIKDDGSIRMCLDPHDRYLYSQSAACHCLS